ncbi:MAG: xanthine dehydrogenase, molybdopterin binding subunit [Polyangiaceae bacterium]|jgi:xanthine dehydrogenase large subunit|nr:xanthine dehydrogenase, molybdopterin binding subunit [Polyangiaceae bacterium]
MSALGKPVSHESARLHVTGAASYVEDLAGDLARLGYAWPVTSPHPHARVLKVDTSAALACPGVLTCLTRTDVAGENDVGPVRHDEPLFPDLVEHHGQAVLWVIGESIEQARLGAEQVRVEYEPLAATLSIAAAIARGSFHMPPDKLRRGEPESALAASAEQLTFELFVGGQEHFYLETQAALAVPEDGASLLVHSSTQHPTETQEIVARVLGIAKHEVTVQCLRMGGAFGGKETQANSWAAVAALGARKLRRPVLVRLTRAQDMSMTGKRHPFLGRFRVGFERDGKLRALLLELFSDGGFSLDLSSPVLFRAMFHADNAYLLPNVDITGRICKTNHVSHTAFRGFGGPQGMLMIEEVMDRVARHLDLPPAEVRQRNFYVTGDTAHYGQEVKDADRIGRIWQELSQSSELAARQEEVRRDNAQNPHRKRGIAITPVKFGISFTTAFFNQAGALVLVYKDGSVQVNHGGTEMGQGLHTKVAQIAAHSLSLPLSAIRVMATRTDKIPNTSATAASCGSDLNGAAVQSACETLKERLTAVAARRFQVAPEDVLFENGSVLPWQRPADAVPFRAVVEQAYLERTPLFATGYYRTPKIHFDRDSGRGKPFHYYAYGAAVSEVEVDGFTGQYRLLRADVLHDVGSSLSPLVDRGQIEGGFLQGVGWLTTEELVWNEHGALSTSGASTYKLPGLGECPPHFNVKLLERAAEPGVVYGSKAVGEPPFMLAISVREALRAAVAAFGTGGVVELAAPATPEAVFWAIEAQREKAAKLSRAAE